MDGRGAEGEDGGRGDVILENDRSPPPLSLPRGASTCIAAIVKSVWTRRRWPLSGSTKPEILDVLDGSRRCQREIAGQAPSTLISADKKNDRSVTIHFYDIAIRLNRPTGILRRERPTFGRKIFKYALCFISFLFSLSLPLSRSYAEISRSEKYSNVHLVTPFS